MIADYSAYLKQGPRDRNDDKRAQVTADVQRDGKVMTVKFRTSRFADLGQIIERAEQLGGGACVANRVVWPA